jgi:hypothetical protein
MAQQSGFAAPADAEYADDFTARDIEVDAFEYFLFSVGEMEIVNLDDVFRRLTQYLSLLWWLFIR